MASENINRLDKILPGTDYDIEITWSYQLVSD